jgi:hypothetical protein
MAWRSDGIVWVADETMVVGWEPARLSADWLDQPPAGTATKRAPDGALNYGYAYVSGWAQDRLGLTAGQAGRLFHPDNTLDALRGLVKGITAADTGHTDADGLPW